MNNFIISINRILKKNYPLKMSFDKINSLSHFEILSNNYKTIGGLNLPGSTSSFVSSFTPLPGGLFIRMIGRSEFIASNTFFFI